MVYVLRELFKQKKRKIPLQKFVKMIGFEYSFVWYRVFTWINDGFINSIDKRYRYKNLRAADCRMRRHLIIDLTGTKHGLKLLYNTMYKPEWEVEAEDKFRSLLTRNKKKKTSLRLVDKVAA